MRFDVEPAERHSVVDIGMLLPMGGVTIKMIVEGESVSSVFIPQLIELHRAGLFPFDRLVKTYPFEQINERIRRLGEGDYPEAGSRLPVTLFTIVRGVLS